MLKKYFPYEYCRSAYDIDYKRLFDIGYRGIIFDIDNTLVPHGADADFAAELLFSRLNELGFAVILLTDNDESRTARFNKNIGALYICNAEKPDPAPYNEAVKMLGLKKDEVIVIGDSMFKDILGAYNASIASIMVKYIGDGKKWLGWHRYMEYALLFVWRFGRYYKRLGGIGLTEKSSFFKNFKLFLKHEMLFCDISPACYKISGKKEVIKRHLKNISKRENYLKTQNAEPLDCVVYSCQSALIKKGKDIDPATQYAKAENILIASKKLNGKIIRPGEVFSFWRIIGPITSKRGYQKGRVIENGKLITGIGGGLCNLGNVVHLLTLHSPLDVTEVHYHSDALAPDHGKRVPMSSGTSVNYNYLDFRFKNNTDQSFQLLTEVRDETLFAELRCEKDIPFEYSISEEDHRFVKENDKYYRMSRIYRDISDKYTGELLKHELIRDNRSEVMFDYSLIPKELIKQ